MTFLAQRLSSLRDHVRHLREIAARAQQPGALEQDRSLRNDVLFSLLMVAQLVVDLAGESATTRGKSFSDYTEAVRGLEGVGNLDHETIAQLALLPGFRNVVMHEYVTLDLDRVRDALQGLDPVERLIRALATSTDS